MLTVLLVAGMFEGATGILGSWGVGVCVCPDVPSFWMTSSTCTRTLASPPGQATEPTFALPYALIFWFALVRFT